MSEHIRCCQAFYQWKNTHYPIKIYCDSMVGNENSQLSYRAFETWKCECTATVSLNHLFNWNFYSSKSFGNQISSSTSQFNVLQLSHNMLWDSFNCSVSLPLFRFALFQWIKHGISECKHFGCAWYNTVSVVYSVKITHTLAHIIQAAKFLKTTEQYRLTELVCIVSTRTLHVMIYFGGVLCLAIHFIVVIS